LNDAVLDDSFLKFNGFKKNQRAFFNESQEEGLQRDAKPRRPRSAGPSNRGNDAEGRSRNAQRKTEFPWTLGAAAGEDAPDDIEQRESERLWRTLRLTERETERREAQLKRELKRLGVDLDESDLKVVSD
jgi:hypothetical protein